jgi:peroxiredoxin Q/BCP
VEANAAFAKKNNFPFPLLSDTERVLARAFGAADNPQARYAKRVSAIIDEQGKILKLYPKVDPRTHAEELLRDLSAL